MEMPNMDQIGVLYRGMSKKQLETAIMQLEEQLNILKNLLKTK